MLDEDCINNLVDIEINNYYGLNILEKLLKNFWLSYK
jgi:hypothetical protein